MPVSPMRLLPPRFALLAAWAALSAVSAPLARAAETRPFVSPLFGEHMVLQQGRANRIWGWCEPGREVRVTLAGAETKTTAGADGRWQAEFAPPAAGGPYALTIDGAERVEWRDVLVGEVWLCGGQSNMAFALSGARDGAAEVQAADFPTIRFFRVGQQVSYSSSPVPPGSWQVCSPAGAGGGGGISAVGYYFARRLQAELHVPVGLVQAAVGGSPIESWMGAETLRRFPEFVPAVAEIERLRRRGGTEYGNYIMHWYDEHEAGVERTWPSPDFDDAAWKTVRLPGGFAELGVPESPAVCWFRREITLPDPLPAGAAKIFLGVVEKMDTTYVNGRWTGASSWVENPRIYPLAAGVLRLGRNVVAIRVFKLKPDGGFQSPADTLRLVLGDGTVVPLAGDWRGAVSVDARAPHPLPLGFENYPTMPTVLHRGMLRPVAPLALAGALWYQGEANFTRAFQYRALLPAMIADWRALFGRDDLPCYLAGLPAFMGRRTEPGTDGWAELREAQALAAQTVPHTGLAVTIDTGEAADIHPKDKRPVGERLALAALRGTYGRDVVASGPTFAAVEKLSGALRIRFAHADGGLVVHGGKLAEFAVAGADRKWRWAEAKIEGDTVVVSSAEVPEPVAVRYAWQANPAASLFNGAGLPAGPFRTDDWPLSTEPPRAAP